MAKVNSDARFNHFTVGGTYLAAGKFQYVFLTNLTEINKSVYYNQPQESKGCSGEGHQKRKKKSTEKSYF